MDLSVKILITFYYPVYHLQIETEILLLSPGIRREADCLWITDDQEAKTKNYELYTKNETTSFLVLCSAYFDSYDKSIFYDNSQTVMDKKYQKGKKWVLLNDIS